MCGPLYFVMYMIPYAYKSLRFVCAAPCNKRARNTVFVFLYCSFIAIVQTTLTMDGLQMSARKPLKIVGMELFAVFDDSVTVIVKVLKV